MKQYNSSYCEILKYLKMFKCFSFASVLFYVVSDCCPFGVACLSTCDILVAHVVRFSTKLCTVFGPSLQSHSTS